MTLLCYRYHNPGFSSMEVWVSQPVAGNTQGDVHTARQSHQVAKRQDTVSGIVLRYHLRRGETLELDWEFEPLASPPLPARQAPLETLSSEDRVHYLRDSNLIGAEQAIRERGRELAGTLTEPVELARAFFDALVKEYGYTWPVWHRGALAMELSRSGDCGQFAALFCALCRVSGIPARPVVGMLLTHAGGMRPHAWAEFWDDACGWLPVDPSLGRVVHPSDQVFSQLPADRFAFSYDMDIALPAYGRHVWPEPVSSTALRLVRFGNHRLAWGAGTINGAVPYLQPAYPRVYAGWGPNWLIFADQIGTWAVDNPPRQRAVASPRVLAIVLAVTVSATFIADHTRLIPLPNSTVDNTLTAVFFLFVALFLWQRIRSMTRS